MSDFTVLGGNGCEFCFPVSVGEGCGTYVPKLQPGERCLFCGRQAPFLKVVTFPPAPIFNTSMFPPFMPGNCFLPPWGPQLPHIYFK